jgi:uncharacterized protein YegL
MSENSEESIVIQGGMVERACRVFLVADVSFSMSGSKINTLNAAIREMIPVLRDAEDESARGTIEIQALAFSAGARWVNTSPVNVQSYSWQGLDVESTTDMGAAFELLAEALDESEMPNNAFAPIIILITDGEPTDDYLSGLKKLNNKRWARSAVRCAIGVGGGTNELILREFLGNDEWPLLNAMNVADLKRFVRWASVTLSQMSSQGLSEASGDNGGDGTKLHIPPPPPPTDSSLYADEDVW